MKRMIVVMAVLAVVIAALASSVNAQNSFDYAMQDALDTATAPVRGMAENLCDAHRGTGDVTEASWCDGVIVNPRTGRVEGYNPNSVRGLARRGYRDDYYYNDGYGFDGGVLGDLVRDDRVRGAVIGTGAGLGIAELLGVHGRDRKLVVGGSALLGLAIGQRNHSNATRGPSVRGADPSKCVKDTLKEFRKRHVSVSADQVLALCGGGSTDPAPRETVEDYGPETQTEASPVPRTEPESVYITKDKRFLCNNTDTAISVYVNGNLVGRLAAGQVVALSSLPQGKVQYFPLN